MKKCLTLLFVVCYHSNVGSKGPTDADGERTSVTGVQKMNKEQNASMEAKKIELTVKELTNKETGKKFLAYKVTTKDGRFMDCKFRKEVKAPSENGFIYVLPANMNVTKNTKYPTLWVKQLEKFVSKEELADEAISEEDFKKLTEMFG